MQLSLRNIKHSPSLSEETNAYTATVYLDGKPFCYVSNRGHGGSDEQRPIIPNTYDDVKRVNEWLAANHPPLDMSAYKMADIPCDLEHWCGEQLTNHLIANDLKRATKNKVLYQRDGKIFVMGIKGKRSLDQRDLDHIVGAIRKKYGDVPILNLIPFGDALAIYRKSA